MRIAIIVLLLVSGSVIAIASAEPKLVRTELAGERLNFATHDYVKLDKKAGYYLISHGDKWETTASALWLRPVNALFGSPEDEASLKQKAERVTLPRLRDGKGVNIGDTPQQVRLKIGFPPQRQHYNTNHKWRDCYYWKNIVMLVPTGKAGSKKKIFQYKARYSFLKDRLVEIEYRYVDPRSPYDPH